MRDKLIRLLLWCLRYLGATPELILSYFSYRAHPVHESLNDLITDASAMWTYINTNSSPGTDVVYRRHWVYTSLIQKHPDRPQKDISLAVELSYNGLGGGR